MVHRHCSLLTGSATIRVTRVGLGIEFTGRMLAQYKVLGSVTVLKGEGGGRKEGTGSGLGSCECRESTSVEMQNWSPGIGPH